jgi:DNA repair protein RecO (recombination protein O)
VKSYSVDAFVIRLRPLGESDRIVTLFSLERGKIAAVAKGSRKPRTKFGARLDFFARSRIELHEAKSLDPVTGAASIAGAWERVVDPEVYSFLSYVAEVIDGLCEPGMPVPELHELLCELQRLVAPASLAGLRPVVDLRILAALGFAIELDACARCGSPLGRRPFAGGRAALSPEAGGLVCRACLSAGSADANEAHRDFGIVRISAAAFELLREARVINLEDACDRPELASIAHVTQAFVQHHLGRRSKALSTHESMTTPRTARRSSAAGA